MDKILVHGNEWTQMDDGWTHPELRKRLSPGLDAIKIALTVWLQISSASFFFLFLHLPYLLFFSFSHPGPFFDLLFPLLQAQRPHLTSTTTATNLPTCWLSQSPRRRRQVPSPCDTVTPCDTRDIIKMPGCWPGRLQLPVGVCAVRPPWRCIYTLACCPGPRLQPSPLVLGSRGVDA